MIAPLIGLVFMVASLVGLEVPWPYYTLLLGYVLWTARDQQRQG